MVVTTDFTPKRRLPRGTQVVSIILDRLMTIARAKSQLEMDLPLIGTFPVSKQPDAGLMPDVAVAPRLEDIVEGKDVEMERVESLLRT